MKADVELPLTLWKKRKRADLNITALVLHSSQEFVFLLDKTAAAQVSRHGIKKVLDRLTSRSPFKSMLAGRQARPGSVLAFEVQWQYIVGMDYTNPLCLDGRLVLEAHQVVKREFSTMDNVYDRYAPQLQSLARSRRHQSVPNFAPDGGSSAREPRTAGLATDVPHRAPSVEISLHGLDLAGPLSARDGGAAEQADDSLHRRESRACRSFSFDHKLTGSDLDRNGVSANGTHEPQKSDRQMCSPTAKRPAPLVIPDEAASWEADLRSYDSSHGRPPGEADNTRDRDGGTSSRPQDPPMSDGLPVESFWTAATAAFEYRTISCNFSDPGVPAALRPVIQGDERLLKLYESGLPAWAIYAPQYGVWYRPWLRRVTYLLFVLVSAFSLVMGFYDLYKNVPYLDKVLRQLGSMYLPSSAVLQWLDNHVSVRLSILLAYLFGKSELAVQLLRWLKTAGAFCRATLQPVISVVGPPLALWGAAFTEAWAQLAATLLGFAQVASYAAKAVFGPPFIAFLDLMLLLQRLVMPLVQVLMHVGLAILLGPWTLLVTIAAALSTSASATWQAVKLLGQTCMTAWQAIKAGTRIAPAVGTTAKELGSQMSWWYFMLPGEALEVVRSSAIKVIRAVQTLSRLCSQVASDIARHRLTLQLRIQRVWQRAKAQLSQLVPQQLIFLCLWLSQLFHGAVDQHTPGLQHETSHADGSWDRLSENGQVSEELPRTDNHAGGAFVKQHTLNGVPAVADMRQSHTGGSRHLSEPRQRKTSSC